MVNSYDGRKAFNILKYSVYLETYKCCLFATIFSGGIGPKVGTQKYLYADMSVKKMKAILLVESKDQNSQVWRKRGKYIMIPGFSKGPTTLWSGKCIVQVINWLCVGRHCKSVPLDFNFSKKDSISAY